MFRTIILDNDKLKKAHDLVELIEDFIACQDQVTLSMNNPDLCTQYRKRQDDIRQEMEACVQQLNLDDLKSYLQDHYKGSLQELSKLCEWVHSGALHPIFGEQEPLKKVFEDRAQMECQTFIAILYKYQRELLKEIDHKAYPENAEQASITLSLNEKILQLGAVFLSVGFRPGSGAKMVGLYSYGEDDEVVIGLKQFFGEEVFNRLRRDEALKEKIKYYYGINEFIEQLVEKNSNRHFHGILKDVSLKRFNDAQFNGYLQSHQSKEADVERLMRHYERFQARSDISQEIKASAQELVRILETKREQEGYDAYHAENKLKEEFNQYFSSLKQGIQEHLKAPAVSKAEGLVDEKHYQAAMKLLADEVNRLREKKKHVIPDRYAGYDNMDPLKLPKKLLSKKQARHTAVQRIVALKQAIAEIEDMWASDSLSMTRTLTYPELIVILEDTKKKMVSTGLHFEFLRDKNTGHGLFGVTGQRNFEDVIKAIEEAVPRFKRSKRSAR